MPRSGQDHRAVERVLVLNASYEPLHRVAITHAIKMLVREVAVIEVAHETAVFGDFRLPTQLRLIRYVPMSWKYRADARCTKSGVRRRDGACGYCGGPAETIDHIVPASRGGPLTWGNAVAACFACNNRKADRTPEEAGMRLRVVPSIPAPGSLALPA